MVSVFDEFGDIEKLDGDRIVKLFRSELQQQNKTVFLFSGSYESIMAKMFMSPSAPFYRFARIIHIDNIPVNDFIEYLTPIFKKESFIQAKRLVKEIALFTGGHPYYTPFMVQQALFHKELFMKEKYYFSELINTSIAAESSYLEKVWDDISMKKQEKAIILEIVKGEKSLYKSMDSRKINIARTLKRLTHSGFLCKINKFYILTDPLLNYWIKENILKQHMERDISKID